MKNYYANPVVRLVFILSLVFVTTVAAEDEVRTERVQFEKGKSEAVISGKIRGYESVEYLLTAGAGQTMEASLETKHGATYFNVWAPGTQPGRDSALFVGETGGNRFEGKLSIPGDYMIQVYMMRSAARRNETSQYTLKVKITGTPDPGVKAPEVGPWPADTSASGNLPCSNGGNSLDLQCAFKVKRNTFGATIWMMKPGETRDPKQMKVEDLRTLYFEKVGDKATWTTSDSTKPAWKRVDDNWIVTIGDVESYKIPDAVIYGG
jgi:hypothetical protein